MDAWLSGTLFYQKSSHFVNIPTTTDHIVMIKIALESHKNYLQDDPLIIKIHGEMGSVEPHQC